MQKGEEGGRVSNDKKGEVEKWSEKIKSVGGEEGLTAFIVQF